MQQPVRRRRSAARNLLPPPLLFPRRLPAGLASMCILGRRSRGPDGGTNATRGANRGGCKRCRVPPCPRGASIIALQPPAEYGVRDAHPPSTTTPYISDPLPDHPPLFFFLAFSCFLVSVLESLCSSVSGFFLGFVIPLCRIYNQQTRTTTPHQHSVLGHIHIQIHIHNARLTTLRVGTRRLRLGCPCLPKDQRRCQRSRQRPLHLRLLQPAGHQGPREPDVGRPTNLRPLPPFPPSR